METIERPFGHGYAESQTIGAIAPALVQALAEIGSAAADSDNPHFRSKYADLASVKEAARPIFKHGLAVTQAVLSAPDGTPGLLNKILHTSGEWMASWAYCKAEKPGPQAVGAVITYLRRYMMAAALNIAQEDDDANSAERQRGSGDRANGNGHQQQGAPPPQPPPASKQAKVTLWFETDKGKEKMKLLHTVLGTLKLGEAGADERHLRGKPREEFTHAAKVAYLCWCIGRQVISSKDLTDAEADKVITKARNGEMPGD
jgi:hypothetical protein